MMIAVLGLRERLDAHPDRAKGVADEHAVAIDRTFVEGRRLVLDHPGQEGEHLVLVLLEEAQEIGHVHLLVHVYH